MDAWVLLCLSFWQARPLIKALRYLTMTESKQHNGRKYHKMVKFEQQLISHSTNIANMRIKLRHIGFLVTIMSLSILFVSVNRLLIYPIHDIMYYNVSMNNNTTIMDFYDVMDIHYIILIIYQN